jgi:glutaconate CoA-transferase, subunit A
MAEILDLKSAVERLVRDGDSVALEGFTHLIFFAAAHEIIRQKRRDLTLVRLTPDLAFDQMIGMGCARALVFSWGGNPGVGSLHRFRDAVENGWPKTVDLDEHSHAGLTNRYVAGASGLPFAVLRAYAGTDLLQHSPTIASIDCPFTGETLATVRALSPDVAIIHAQQADRSGNVQLWGITGGAAERSIVTVEEIVDRLVPQPGGVVLPSCVVTAVAPSPGARTRHTASTTRNGTMTSTSRGTRSAGTATRFWRGCRSTWSTRPSDRDCEAIRPGAVVGAGSRGYRSWTVSARRACRSGTPAGRLSQP